MFFVAHLRLQAIIHQIIVIMGHPAQMPTPSQKKTSYPGFIWGTSGETSGLLGDKVGITRGDKKGLGVKNNESVTISDLNNDGKGDIQFSEPCSKSKLSAFSLVSIFLRGVAGHSRFLMWTVRIC